MSRLERYESETPVTQSSYPIRCKADDCPCRATMYESTQGTPKHGWCLWHFGPGTRGDWRHVKQITADLLKNGIPKNEDWREELIQAHMPNPIPSAIYSIAALKELVAKFGRGGVVRR